MVPLDTFLSFLSTNGMRASFGAVGEVAGIYLGTCATSTSSWTGIRERLGSCIAYRAAATGAARAAPGRE